MLVLTCVFILAYGWSSRVTMPRPTRLGTGKHTGMWKHHEGVAGWWSWVRNSTVCDLGIFSWFAWSAAVLALLVAPADWARCIRRLLAPLLLITATTMAVMNVPLLLRSLPAFALLAAILVRVRV